MELLLKRIARRETYTIGRLYVDGVYVCDTLEDKDRGLKQSDAYAANKRKKVQGQTAIPTGRYQVTLGVKSPKYSLKNAYDWCGGYLPRVLNVPCFDGILIHAGNTAKDTEGCILVGRNTQVGKVLESMVTLKRLYGFLKPRSFRNPERIL